LCDGPPLLKSEEISNVSDCVPADRRTAVRRTRSTESPGFSSKLKAEMQLIWLSLFDDESREQTAKDGFQWKLSTLLPPTARADMIRLTPGPGILAFIRPVAPANTTRSSDGIPGSLCVQRGARGGVAVQYEVEWMVPVNPPSALFGQ
jgi:hypothetical protein